MNVEEDVRRYLIDNILFGDDAGLQVDTSFEEHGVIDSVGFLDLLAFLEKNYQIEIEDHDLIPENFDTLQRIGAFIERKLDPNASPQRADPV